MSAQIALARPRFRHCLSSRRRFQRRSRFPQTVLPVLEAVAGMMRVAERPAVRVVTAVNHFDRIAPEPVKVLRWIGSTPPAPPHSASYYARKCNAQPRHKRGD